MTRYNDDDEEMEEQAKLFEKDEESELMNSEERKQLQKLLFDDFGIDKNDAPYIAFIQKLLRIISEKEDLKAHSFSDKTKEVNDNAGNVHKEKVDTSFEPLAYTEQKPSGSEVTINVKKVLNESPDEPTALLSLKGLAYHELGHVLYTNYDKNLVVSSALNEGLMPEMVRKSINILDDARIESILAFEYPNMRDFFLYNALTHIVNPCMTDEKNSFSGLLLTYGRKYIGRDVVATFEARTRTTQNEKIVKNLERIKEVIDTYITAKTEKERLKLAVEFTKLCAEENGSMTQQHEHATEVILKVCKHTGSKGAKKELSKDVNDALKKAIEELEADLPSKDAPSSDKVEANARIKKELENIMARNRKQGEREVMMIERANQTCGNTSYKITDGEVFEPSHKEVGTAQRLTRELRKLRNGMDSRYTPKQKVGRFDLRRVMNTRGTSTRVFRKYKPSVLAKSRMAVSLLIDSSGSMGTEAFRTACGSAWALSTALAQQKDAVQVYEFDTESNMMKSFHSRRANWKRTLGGGTSPEIALKNAFWNTKDFQRGGTGKTSLLFVLTDGCYQNDSDERVKDFKKNGGYSVLVGIGQDLTGLKAHNNFDAFASINDVAELNSIVRDTIKVVQLKIRKQLGVKDL